VPFRRAAPPRRWSFPSVAFASIGCFALAAALVARIAGPWHLGVGGRTLVSVTTLAKPVTVALWCAILGIVASVPFSRAWAEQSAFAFYTGAAIVMYVFSFGPEPAFLGHPFWYKAPYAWLMELPGFSSVRAPARFAMLAELCLSVAVAAALVRIRQYLPRRFATGLAIAALVGAIADGWILGLPLPNLPPRIAALESVQQGAVVELPLGFPGDIAALYRSIYHHRPTVNGYSGFAPVHYLVLGVALDAGETDALGALTAGSPLTVVDAQGHITTMPPVGDETATAGRPLRIQSAMADGRPLDLGAITDGNRVSRWFSGLPQRGDESITLDLGSIEEVDGVTLSIGQYLGDYPRVLTIETSEDREAWTSRWSGRGASKAVAGALRDPARVPVTFGFPETRARWIRLRQIGADPRFPWSIAELTVLGR
jgi:hypothetical protein